MKRAAWLALLLTVAACAEVTAPKAPSGAEPRDVKASPGIQIQTACVPSGVERCFNAYDDNCNGLIDEGCGVQSGVLQFVIAWEAPEADVDLMVTSPDGQVARSYDASAGLIKDRDCPRDSELCAGQNIENVFLPADAPTQRGVYRVVVRLDKLNDAAAPVRVRLAARVGQRSYAMLIELAPGPDTEDRTFEFTL